jgi:hypothetical protein
MRIAKLTFVSVFVFPVLTASAQIVDSPGFFFQSEGTLTVSDTNPFFGGNSMPYVEGYEWNVDMDPMYDWMILETMVSDHSHVNPFHLWPASEPTGAIPFGTHEMGYSMGLVGVWHDINGADRTQWGRGMVMLRAGIGMNHQENDGHSGLSWWTDMRRDAPWPIRFIGSTGDAAAWSGAWFAQYGAGWIYRGEGTVNWYRLNLDWDMTGRFDQFRIEPFVFNFGDLDLDQDVTYGDVEPFIKVLRGDDHDLTRVGLSDFTEDGFVDYDDLILFIERLLR